MIIKHLFPSVSVGLNLESRVVMKWSVTFIRLSFVPSLSLSTFVPLQVNVTLKDRPRPLVASCPSVALNEGAFTYQLRNSSKEGQVGYPIPIDLSSSFRGAFGKSLAKERVHDSFIFGLIFLLANRRRRTQEKFFHNPGNGHVSYFLF